MAKKCNSRLKQYGLGDWIDKGKDKWWGHIPGISALSEMREDGEWDFSADNLYMAGVKNSGMLGTGLTMLKGDEWMKENAGTLGTVTGGVAGALLGNPMLGAQIGGGLGQMAQGQYESEVGLANQAEMMQKQTDAYNTNMAQMNEQNRLNALRQQRLSGMYNNTPQQYGSMMANGGMMKSYSGNTVPSNKAGTYFANGGTHEQNPLGGIPIGNKGSVEEGEYLAKLKDGDYIFSNRF